MNKIISRPEFREALMFWLKLGFISFGGPAGQIAIMHEFIVEKKKWLSESKFLHSLNYCMLLPGPEAQQLATYIGWLLHNVKGGLAAGILFVLPSVFILLILSILYVTFGKIPMVYAIFDGLKPAVVAIVMVALIKLAGKSLKSFSSYLIAGLSFIFIYFFQIPFPYIIVSTIILSVIINYIWKNNSEVKETEKNIPEEESNYLINSFTETVHSKLSVANTAGKFFIFVILWTIPVFLFNLFSGNTGFWNELVTFFTKSAFVTFGGAYSVLTYVAQVAVEKYFWLTDLQMIDGLALGETTPGPLVMVLSFVGFMAGFTNSGGSVVTGTIALLTTTYYTFLPGFFFIFIGAPFIELTQHNEKIKSVLNFVTAAVVGVILNLTVYIGIAVIFPDGISSSGMNHFGIIWIIISFLALQFYKVNIIKWIGISSLSGIMYFFIF